MLNVLLKHVTPGSHWHGHMRGFKQNQRAFKFKRAFWDAAPQEARVGSYSLSTRASLCTARPCVPSLERVAVLHMLASFTKVLIHDPTQRQHALDRRPSAHAAPVTAERKSPVHMYIFRSVLPLCLLHICQQIEPIR